MPLLKDLNVKLFSQILMLYFFIFFDKKQKRKVAIIEPIIACNK